MAKKPYEWEDGAVLEEHSKQKHKVLREYFFQYLTTRCQLPQQEKFRLAIVDGFAGGGRYNCGSAGSPIIFMEQLKLAINAINIDRQTQSLRPIEIECLLILNDDNQNAFESLKRHCAPKIIEMQEEAQKLHLQVRYHNEKFETIYPIIKGYLQSGRYRNVVFNLDQCGHKHVSRKTLTEIIQLNPSAEIFYTFAIESLLSFLKKSDPIALSRQLSYLGLSSSQLDQLNEVMSKQEWLGTAERIVHDTFKSYAPFVSPFSINNPDGWRYWLVHFANKYRARQVYNDVLHNNSTSQAHFGRAGLNMLSFDPNHADNSLYLFDTSGRKEAKTQLIDDIPRLVSEHGDILNVGEFYEGVYNLTAAHTDDIHAAIAENPDLEVITPAGGERRKANTISSTDTIKLKAQKSFSFPKFPDQ